MVEVCLPRWVVCHAEPAKRNLAFFHLFCDCESQELLSFDFKMKRNEKIQEIILTSSINFFCGLFAWLVCLHFVQKMEEILLTSSISVAVVCLACVLAFCTGRWCMLALHLKYLSTWNISGVSLTTSVIKNDHFNHRISRYDTVLTPFSSFNF